MWRRSGFPDRHMTSARETAKNREETGWWAAHDYMSKRFGSDGTLFILTGPRGTGKTQMSACLARLMALQKQEVKYIRASDMYDNIKATYGGTEGDTSKEVISNSVRPRLLIIDDMQDANASNWEGRILNQIIDRRYGSHKDTVLITNDREEALPTKLGSSVMSRADEIGGIIQTDWASFRS